MKGHVIMNIKPVGNIRVGYLHSKGYSSLYLSFYLSSLVFDFAPWLGADNTGRNYYDNKKRLSTSVNLEGAAYFYLVAVTILRGEDRIEPIEATLPCKNNSSLTLSYLPDENNQMTAYLDIHKDNQTIPFKFQTLPKQVMVNGQMVTKAVQADLADFAMMLFGYITGSSGEDYLRRIFNEGLNP
jgi:hypothetical protein